MSMCKVLVSVVLSCIQLLLFSCISSNVCCCLRTTEAKTRFDEQQWCIFARVVSPLEFVVFSGFVNWCSPENSNHRPLRILFMLKNTRADWIASLSSNVFREKNQLVKCSACSLHLRFSCTYSRESPLMQTRGGHTGRQNAMGV